MLGVLRVCSAYVRDTILKLAGLSVGQCVVAVLSFGAFMAEVERSEQPRPKFCIDAVRLHLAPHMTTHTHHTPARHTQEHTDYLLFLVRV